jgi:hypothetical protein
VKYPNGRSVSSQVYQALRYMTKVGVMSKKTWNELFGKGSTRWKTQQLRLLREAKIIRLHPHELKDSFVIGSAGMELVREQKWKPVHFVDPKYFKHDEMVACGVWKLEGNSICSKWFTEKELKNQSSNSFKLDDLENGKVKYPDAVMKIEGKKRSLIVALEYEKTMKSNWRYNKAIKAYSDSKDFNYIIFMVESAAIEKSIKRSLRYIGDGHLSHRIGFISIEDWMKDPLLAPIRTPNEFKNLQEMTSKN